MTLPIHQRPNIMATRVRCAVETATANELRQVYTARATTAAVVFGFVPFKGEIVCMLPEPFNFENEWTVWMLPG